MVSPPVTFFLRSCSNGVNRIYWGFWSGTYRSSPFLLAYIPIVLIMSCSLVFTSTNFFSPGISLPIGDIDLGL